MVIDTNVYSALRAGNADAVKVLRSQDCVYVPVPVVAELRQGFEKGNRTEQNMEELTSFLSRDESIVLSCDYATTDSYALVANYCVSRGRALSHNDVWIAAIAIQHDIPLLTFDKDFEILLDLLPVGSLVL